MSASSKVREAFAFVNRSASDGAEEIFTRGCRLRIPRPFGEVECREGMSEILAMNDAYHAAFPEFEFTVVDLVEDGDKVVARWRVSAYPTHHVVEPLTQTHVTPTVESIAIEGLTFFRIADGKIDEWMQLEDDLGMMLQLGVSLDDLPPAESGGKPDQEPAAEVVPNTPGKAVVCSYIDRVMNEACAERRARAMQELVRDDVCVGGPDAGSSDDGGSAGFAQLVAGYDRFRAAFPTARFTITDIAEHDGKVAARWVVQDATHDGPLQLGGTELAATGNSGNVHGAGFFETRDGKIQSLWLMSDMVSMVRQLIA